MMSKLRVEVEMSERYKCGRFSEEYFSCLGKCIFQQYRGLQKEKNPFRPAMVGPADYTLIIQKLCKALYSNI